MSHEEAVDQARHGMFIVKNDGRYYGPFKDYETSVFASKLHGETEVVPLRLPSTQNDTSGPTKVELLDAAGYRAHVDSFKIDVHLVLAGTTQGFYFARREQRVLTAQELDAIWEDLYEVSRSVESLMHYVELVIADPKPENMEALRKAFWRNRDSDDVDPHYQDRFW